MIIEVNLFFHFLIQVPFKALYHFKHQRIYFVLFIINKLKYVLQLLILLMRDLKLEAECIKNPNPLEIESDESPRFQLAKCDIRGI